MCPSSPCFVSCRDALSHELFQFSESLHMEYMGLLLELHTLPAGCPSCHPNQQVSKHRRRKVRIHQTTTHLMVSSRCFSAIFSFKATRRSSASTAFSSAALSLSTASCKSFGGTKAYRNRMNEHRKQTSITQPRHLNSSPECYC